jgi:glucose-specific phosphotransferase system IIA component
MTKIYSPLKGEVIAIEKVADPVFAEKMLGDGIAIRPTMGKQEVLSPCDGEVVVLHPSCHALAILADDGTEVLVHVGIDTVKLEGEGFKNFVNVGDKVKKGQKVLEADFDFLVKNAPSIDTIIIITNLSEKQKLIKTNKQEVNVLDEILMVE